MDMKYKVYCVSAMMLCCMASEAQEKDTVGVGDSVKNESQLCTEKGKDTYHTGKSVERYG